VAHRFRLLISHDRSRYMVLQTHLLAFMCLILVGLACGFSVCLTCVNGHSFSHSMNTHEPFIRFDGFLDSFSWGMV
jgi:TRAP-type mannitol/chloroaromatic compound transport system permease large subunit